MSRTLRDSAITRWAILVILGFILAANYYFYDAISPLKSLLEKNFGFTSTDFGLFVSFYSIPNTFLLMAVLGGIILDRLGIRRTGFLFVFLMALGAIITAYGASDTFRNNGFAYAFMSGFLPDYSPELKMMLLGRFFFGLGAETSIVVISKTIVKWFKGKELALAFGVKLGFARLGSTLAFNLSPALVSNGNISPSVWFAAILVCIALLAFVAYIFFDIKLDRQQEQQKLINKDEVFKLSDLLDLLKNNSFLYITALCLLFYSAVFPFLSFSADFFLNKYGLSLERSGAIASLLPIGTVIFTPLFGLYVDKKGNAASLMILGSAILMLVHFLFMSTQLPPYIPMIMLGIAFSLVPAAMWPSVARIVDENRLGTAYGLMFSIQNLGLWGFPIMAGIILDNTNKSTEGALNYGPTMLMFLILGSAGMVFALLLRRYSIKNGRGLDKPMKPADEKKEK